LVVQKRKSLRKEVNKMYTIFEKRALWNVHLDGKLVAKFATEEEAKEFAGWVPPVEETLNGSKEKEAQNSKKEANTDKQKTVLNSKSSYKKKV
jgi:hypothetical protein